MCGLTGGQVWKTAGGTVTGGKAFTYDGAGDMVTAANAAGTYTLTYDDAGRVGSVDEPVGLCF